MKEKPSRLRKNLIEMGQDLKDIGLLDDESYQKITMRLLKKENKVPKIAPMKSKEIRAIREREHLSQAAFAHYLNLTVGFVSQLERGLKQPRGPLLTLLHVVQKNGLSLLR